MSFICQVCGVTGRQYTYAHLRDHCAALAIRLQHKFNLESGDVIAICLPNCPEYPVATFGAIEAGLVVTTINPTYTAGELRTIETIVNYCISYIIVCPSKLLVGLFWFSYEWKTHSVIIIESVCGWNCPKLALFATNCNHLLCDIQTKHAIVCHFHISPWTLSFYFMHDLFVISHIESCMWGAQSSVFNFFFFICTPHFIADKIERDKTTVGIRRSLYFYEYFFVNIAVEYIAPPRLFTLS